MKKQGRNDPCLCGSGKKFKKCCESLMLSGRFKFERIDAKSSVQIQKTVGLTPLFQARLAETPKKSMPPAPLGEQGESMNILEQKAESLLT